MMAGDMITLITKDTQHSVFIKEQTISDKYPNSLDLFQG